MLRFFLVLALLACGAPLYAASPLPSAAKAADATTTVTDGGTVSPTDPYTIQDVKVDVKAENSNKARDKAFTEGGRQAFRTLSKNLAANAGFDPKSVDDATIGKMIKSFEVQEERASGVRYLATLTFHFKQDEAVDLFEKRAGGIVDKPSAGEASTQTGDAPNGANKNGGATPAVAAMHVLVLPVLRSGGRNVLWEENTSWHKAWENVLANHTAPDFILPDATVEDISAISATEALAGMRPPLVRLMQQYHAQGVIVAALIAPALDPAPTQDLTVQLARFDETGLMQETRSITLQADARQKQPVAWLQSGVAMAMKAEREAMAEKAKQTAEVQATELAHSGIDQLTVVVPFASTQDWLERRASLQEIASVAKLDMLSLNRARAILRISYKGARDQFEADLSNHNLQLAPPSGQSNGNPLLLPANDHKPDISDASPTRPVFETVYPAPQQPEAPPDQATTDEEPATPGSGEPNQDNGQE